MDRAKKAWEGANIRSYTSAFPPTVQQPSESEIENVTSMMKDLWYKVDDVQKLYQKLIEFLPVREKTLQLIAAAIVFLNVKHRDVNIAKVTGNSVSLIGDGLVIGGAVAAPFTLGLSLIVSAVGGAVCAVGGVTSAGASIVELCITKKKVSQIQEAVEKDEALSNEIQRMWQDIVSACSGVAEKHSAKGYSFEDVISVLLVCCINTIPDKLLAKFKAPNVLRQKVYSDPRAMADCTKKLTPLKESANHAGDVAGDVGGGLKSAGDVVKAGGGIVLTALILKTAGQGTRAVVHCSKMVGVSKKVVSAARLFRVATGTNPVIAVAFSTVFSVIDVASLIYGAYQIHKKSDSSAGKELIRMRDELKESRDQLLKMKDCLSDVINSMQS